MIERRAIYIGNLHYKVDENDIHAHFLHCGPVNMICYPKTNNHRGYAFVEFKSSKSVKIALEEHDTYLGRYRIIVNRKHYTTRCECGRYV